MAAFVSQHYGYSPSVTDLCKQELWFNPPAPECSRAIRQQARWWTSPGRLCLCLLPCCVTALAFTPPLRDSLSSLLTSHSPPWDDLLKTQVWPCQPCWSPFCGSLYARWRRSNHLVVFSVIALLHILLASPHCHSQPPRHQCPSYSVTMAMTPTSIAILYRGLTVCLILCNTFWQILRNLLWDTWIPLLYWD